MSRRTRRVRLGRQWSDLAAMRAAVVEVFDVTVGDQRGSVFDGDYYAVDGVSGTTQSLIDRIDNTHTLTQGTSANQCAISSADAALKNSRSLTFAATEYYVSSRAASLWRYMHGDSSTPCTAVIVFVPTTDGASVATSTVFATVRQQDSASATGAFTTFATTTTTGEFNYRVTRSTATFTLNITVSGAPFSQGTGYSLRFRYAEGAGSPEYSAYKSGVSLSAGDSILAPATSSPASALVFGANAVTFDRRLAGRIAFAGFAPKDFSASEVSLVSAYLVAKYGVAT
jgi:hypothetical protein